MSILVVFASGHGHTGRIAARVAEVLAADGLVADVRDLGERGSDPRPEGHDAVVVGASIHLGHHEKEVVRWLKDRRTGLAAVPTALFSVSLTAADDDEEAHASVQRWIDELLTETGWTPDLVTPMAGALQYREYNRFTRGFMKRIAEHDGRPTDTSTDVDLTDWDGVDRFAHAVAALVRPPAP